MRNLCVLSAACLFSFCGSVTASYAAIINAPSCSYTDVSAALANASAGDIVSIPAGECTWSSTLTISKPLTLMGAGPTSTVITWGGSTANSSLINISLESNLPLRISNIGFDLGANNQGYRTAIYIAGSKGGTLELTGLRIDHCKFNLGYPQIFVIGWVYGVIDSNTFIDGYLGIYISADNNNSWARTIAAGTANALFIEDNTFTTDASVPSQPAEAVYHQEGARTVVRYNTFDSTVYTGGNGVFFDSHGNQDYYTGTNNDFRGQPILEVYNNTFRAYKTYQFMGFRSGSELVHDNQFTTTVGTANPFKLSEEEAWQTAYFEPLRATWPAEDQINNSFFWDNTYNGSPVTDVYVNPLTNEGTFIRKDRDYFMHAPAASGGSEHYTNRLGAAGSSPTDGNTPPWTYTGTMIFSSSGASAYYPYTPYIYPHPLREPQPPQGLETEQLSCSNHCS